MENNKLQVEREILLFAFRYSLYRMSYAPLKVTEAIKNNIENISTHDIKLFIKEINDCEDYGMEYDKDHWLNFSMYLEGVISGRK